MAGFGNCSLYINRGIPSTMMRKKAGRDKSEAQQPGSRIPRGWRRIGLRLRLISATEPQATPSPVAFDTARASFALAAAEQESKELPQVQALVLPKTSNTNVNILGNRAFSLRSDRILLQHETQPGNAWELFDLKRKGDCFFSVFDRKSQQLQWLEGQHPYSDLPQCYLPTGPILSQIQDEIHFLDPRDAFRSLALAQGKAFLTEHGLSWEFLSNLPCASLGSEKYVFISQAKNSDAPRQLTLCHHEQGKIHILSSTECAHVTLLNSIVTLSPDLFCVSSFTHFYLFQLDENNEIRLINSFHINKINGLTLRYSCVDVISAISSHEIILFAYANTIPTAAVLLKIDFQSKQIHELISPYELSKNICMLSASPPLFLFAGILRPIIYFFDPQEMVLVPLQKPESITLQGIMPDKSLILKHSGGKKISLFSPPYLQEIANFNKKWIQDNTPLPAVLSEIVSDYAGGDVKVKLSTHFSGFYQRKITQKPRMLALEEVTRDDRMTLGGLRQ